MMCSSLDMLDNMDLHTMRTSLEESSVGLNRASINDFFSSFGSDQCFGSDFMDLDLMGSLEGANDNTSDLHDNNTVYQTHLDDPLSQPIVVNSTAPPTLTNEESNLLHYLRGTIDPVSAETLDPRQNFSEPQFKRVKLENGYAQQSTPMRTGNYDQQKLTGPPIKVIVHDAPMTPVQQQPPEQQTQLLQPKQLTKRELENAKLILDKWEECQPLIRDLDLVVQWANDSFKVGNVSLEEFKTFENRAAYMYNVLRTRPNAQLHNSLKHLWFLSRVEQEIRAWKQKCFPNQLVV
mmetsp:Transcript_6818/g.7466  ORF Transcript_6818/g.7466 Transcript_6818/m.7466 type:complete len:292 (+) Transcript_6818:146-1021(+)